MEYMNTQEIAKVWDISPRRVQILCKNGRIPGAINKGIWLIPSDATKPEDPRKNKKVEKTT